jgi:hypothetical protein
MSGAWSNRTGIKGMKVRVDDSVSKLDEIGKSLHREVEQCRLTENSFRLRRDVVEDRIVAQGEAA